MKKFLLALALSVVGSVFSAAPARPNIVFIITDDQGYGDLGYTGNPVVKTPFIDKLAAESPQLSDYHVAPTCSPTRAALLTGHWTNRTGVWHTINGRSMLRDNEITLGQLLKDSGYATAMFGKWHLGDTYPYRAEDRGFTEVYRHGGGGVGQTPDLWDNAYFDGHYYHNGKVEPAKGFCTDVFFEQAQKFIRAQTAKKQPFFAYIALNAPHGPLHAPQKYMDMYADQSPELAAFFGMITNIDDNVGSMRALLRELAIEENTLLVFTTDNGTASGEKVFNAGMKGKKNSEYEGGHRVPFIAHWPAAGWDHQHVNDTLCHAVDIVPTMLDITGAKKPDQLKFDGVSIRPLLDPSAKTDDWPERFLITDSQRVRDPVKWRKSAVMSEQWRLVNGKELYEIKKDPGQEHDVAAEHPDQVAKMTAFYEAWWAELEPTFANTTEIYLGHPEHPVVSLSGHDWIQENLPPWNQQQIRQAMGFGPPRRPAGKAKKGNAEPAKSKHEGYWAAKVITPGSYEISLRRWPVEANQAITAALPAGANVPGGNRAYRAYEGISIPATTATLRLDGKDLETQPIPEGAVQVTFTTTLTAGSHQLSPVFTSADGQEVGAYYSVITAK